MPDWTRYVAERLVDSKLAPEEQHEVVAEIAEHLEEGYLELQRDGHSDAEQQMLAQVSDWGALCRNIRRSKEDPMNVARRVVLPGIVAAIVAFAVLRLFVYLLITPEACAPIHDTVLLNDSACLTVSADGPAYPPWLLTLPLAGALAATLARWHGARAAQRLIAAVSPAIYLCAETLVMSVLDNFYWRIPVFWVIIPAIACAIGALPFLGDRRDPLETRPVATAHS